MKNQPGASDDEAKGRRFLFGVSEIPWRLGKYWGNKTRKFSEKLYGNYESGVDINYMFHIM